MKNERGFTLVEIMIVVAIIALLAAIAIPNVLRGRTTANESAAIGNLRAVLSSLEMFRSVNNTYPLTTTWKASMYGADCLVGTQPDPDFGPPSFCHATELMTVAAPRTVQGFIYDYLADAAGNSYVVNAHPATPGTTGTRAFFADQTGLLHHCTAAALADRAVSTDPTIDAAPAAC